MAVQWFNPYYVFGGEGGSGTGKVFTKTENGLVPAPGASAGDDLVLRSDGTWGQGGGGSATVGLGKQAKEAMWPAEYTKVSSSVFPTLGQWDFKNPEDFYKEMQELPGYGIQASQQNGPFIHENVPYMQQYLKDPEVKSSIIKFVEFCHKLGAPVYACWANTGNYRNYFYIYTPDFAGKHPVVSHSRTYGQAVRGYGGTSDNSASPFIYQASYPIPEEEQIVLPSVSNRGELSNVKITSTQIIFDVRTNGTEVIVSDSISGPSFIDAQYPAPEPESGKTLPYTPNYIGGCLSANISGYNNYGTLSSIKYDAGNLTFINTQGAVVISVPGATATGEAELTLDDLQKIVYNEESSPKKLEIYDKTGTLRFTVNDTSSGN